MTTDPSHTTVALRSRAKLTKLVYAVLFLIATSGLFYFVMTAYDVQLVRSKQFQSAFAVEEYFALAESLFFFLQLLLVLFFLHIPRQIFDVGTAHNSNRSVFRNSCLGVFAGLTALLATIPSFIWRREPSGIVRFLADHLSIGSALGLALLLGFLLPVAEAIFFDGILLKQLLESISVISALIVSTLVLMLLWPAFSSWAISNLIAGTSLGLATGIVFWRTKSVLACAIANAAFTVGAITFQLWRLP